MKLAKNRLDKNDIEFFYDILYMCENDNELKGFSFNDRNLKCDILRKVSIKQATTINDNYKPNNNTIVFTQSYKKGRRMSQPASLLIRLRNAFAHTLIESDGNHYEFKDISSRNGCHLTMVGKVEKDLLKQLVNDLLENRKHH